MQRIGIIECATQYTAKKENQCVVLAFGQYIKTLSQTLKASRIDSLKFWELFLKVMQVALPKFSPPFSP